MAERARLVLLVVLVAGAGLLGFRHGERAVDALPVAAELSAPAEPSASATPHALDHVDLPPLGDPTVAELAHAWPRLREAAARGRADAAFAMYRVSERCMNHQLAADAKIPEMSDEVRELCAKADRLDVAAHYAYLAQAVRGGHVPAIRVALNGPRSLAPFGTADRHAEIVRNAEHFAELHRAVRTAVERALAAGDREILFQYALALRGNGLLREDPDAAYAHMFASFLAPDGTYGADTPAEHAADIARYWSPGRVAAARREGERIARTHFGWKPAG